MGTAEDSDQYMVYLSTLPGVLSVISCVLVWLMCNHFEHNKNFFSSKIVKRIAISTGCYSLVNCFSPKDGEWDSASEVYPVMNTQCYTQSVMLIGLENLTYFWQCALMHNVYEVTAKKNLRPENLLVQYDNVAVLFSLVISLLPWSISGYGWLWYGRCKYSLYESGQTSKVLTTLVHACCIAYVLCIGIKMRWSVYLETTMTTNYRMIRAMERHTHFQRKLVLMGWAWVLCRTVATLVTFANGFKYLTTNKFMTMPDDLPFTIVAIDALSTECIGIGMFIIFCIHDHRQIRTSLLRTPCFKNCYCLNKVIDYESERKAVSAEVLERSELDECNLQRVLAQHHLTPDAPRESSPMIAGDGSQLASPRHSSMGHMGSFGAMFDSAQATPYFKHYKPLDSLIPKDCPELVDCTQDDAQNLDLAHDFRQSITMMHEFKATNESLSHE